MKSDREKNKLKYYAYISTYKVQQLYDQLVAVRPDKVKITKGKQTDAAAEAGISKIISFLSASFKYGHRRTGRIEIEGEMPLLQKLHEILKHIREHERVKDLGTLCSMQTGEFLDAFAYTYSGKFTAFGTMNRVATDKYYSEFLKDIRLSGVALERAPDTIVISKSALIDPAVAENQNPDIWKRKGSNIRLISDIALLFSQVGDYLLELACSYKYFSDMGGSLRYPDLDGEFEVNPHSGNYHFFDGRAEAYFDSIIFINDVRGKHIFGTPLFLAMAPNPKLLI
jgi:hypothetical protein